MKKLILSLFMSVFAGVLMAQGPLPDDVSALEVLAKTSIEAQAKLGTMYANGDGVAPDAKLAEKWLKKAADKGNNEARYQLGMLYLSGKLDKIDFKKAIKLISQSAQGGNDAAQFELGECYAKGYGVDRDEQTALRWFIQAGLAGNRDAQLRLMNMYANGTGGVARDLTKSLEWKARAANQGDQALQLEMARYYQQLGNMKDAAVWLEKCAESGMAEPAFELGRLYLEGKAIDKDVVKAYRYLSQAASRGIKEANAPIGLLCFYGIGGEENRPKALEYFEKDPDSAIARYMEALTSDLGSEGKTQKGGEPANYRELSGTLSNPKYASDIPIIFDITNRAARMGNREAQYSLGVMYTFEIGQKLDTAEGYDWFMGAAEAELPQAQFYVGYYYDKGIGVDRNSREAARWYKLAADQGLSRAQNNIGTQYLSGEGTERNTEEAIRSFRLAADQGSATAQYNLGVCYAKGNGVEQSWPEALKYFRLAADQGVAEALAAIGSMYFDGEGVSADYPEAAKYFKLAADQGDFMGMVGIAKCYEDGLGVDYNLEKAAKYYKLASSIKSLPEVEEKLGTWYENGIGVEMNMNEAFRHYKAAADRGDTWSQYKVGRCFEFGDGTGRDYSQAVKYYRLAADKEAEAAYRLASCYEGGKGVAQNDAEAIKYYKKAKAMGKYIVESPIIVTSAHLDHNEYYNGSKGMYVRYDFETNWMKGEEIKCVAEIYRANGSPVYRPNSRSQDSHTVYYTPNYIFSKFSDKWIHFPYGSMALPSGKTDCYVSLKFYNARTGKLLDSRKLNFTLTR